MTRLPPKLAPATIAQREIPKRSASLASAAHMSRMVISGKRGPHGAPSGAGDAGPVEPWQPPSTFGQTTKYRSVSIARPGPTTSFHHPSSPLRLVACESPVKAWHRSTALEASASREPQVS